MQGRDDRELKDRRKVRVRTRVTARPRPKITIIKMALVLLAASLTGIIIGIVLAKLLSGAIKNAGGDNQVPVPSSFPTPPAAGTASSPVASPGIGD